jgi:hypothetical protein
MHYILDQFGYPVPEPDVLKWAAWFGTAERTIARDELPGDVAVSTIFLGLDHGFGYGRQLYETMVFGGPLDNEQERYATRQAAIDGHARIVARARNDSAGEGEG